MQKSNVLRVVQAFVLAAPIPALIYAHSTSVDAGFSGAPAEQNCQFCHSSGNGFGGATITFPNGQFYTPGQAQTLLLTVSDASKSYWGFQLTARQSSNTSTQAGYFTPNSDGFTQVVCDDGSFTAAYATSGNPKNNEQFGPTPCPSKLPLQWIEHTLLGNFPGQKRSGTWQFTWTPPSSDVGPVVMYLAGVASDGALNDNVYITRYALSVPGNNQPAITGAVDGAGQQSAVSPGAYLTVYGSNLSNSTRGIGSGDIVRGVLPTSLDGVGLTLGTQACYPIYISPTQINAIVPSNAPAGSNIQVQVSNNGALSYPGSINVNSTVAPGLFAWNNKYAVATRTDFSLVGPPNLFSSATTVPAKSGDTVILWASGLGSTTPAIPPNFITPATTIANVTRPPTVLIGGIAAQLISAALAPGYASLYQVAVQVPSGLSDGDQTVVVQSGGYSSAPGIYLNINNSQ